MDYRRMMEEARKLGKGNELTMWASIESVSDLLEDLREDYPDKYWAFMRRAHEDIHGKHYNEEFARWDIEQMHSTDPNGIKHIGQHWSKAEVVQAMQGHPMAASVTECDKWVAANAMWHDLHRGFDDKQIILATILFFFADTDWQGDGKIWCYMNMRRK